MRSVITLVLTMLITLTINGQALQDIRLNNPDMDRGLTIMKAFGNRASATSFNSMELSLQDLSDLLWATNGINRPESGKRTAPTAVNAQDVDVYVLMKSGAYLYDARTNSLKGVAPGDNRKLVSDRQTTFANAPVMIVLVSDISRFRGDDNERKLSWAAMDAGIVSQNVSLFCAGAGLVTRPRASMDIEGLKKLLSLSATQYPLLNNPVGYPNE
ncbi:MAG: SagB/ThcOx family dehydrogenase [Bacteroidales bacterium]|jgi:SagB-type dehydrogenase family enzyme|nr:SagB/ThcOx family dehydrogenase [Bacteroidales bacterium]